jgi:hypothetical protein
LQLDNVRVAIDEACHRLQNICFHTVSSQEKWDDEKGEWKRDGEWESDAVYVADVGGSARIDVSKQISEWTAGNATFASSKFVTAFDGRSTKTLFTQQGSATQPVTQPEGRIEAERSTIFTSTANGTGWYFTIYGALDPQSKPFTWIFDLNASGRIHLSADTAPFDGNDCVRLTQLETRGPNKSLYYLDAKTYALREWEVYFGDICIRRFHIVEMATLSSDIQFPARIKSEVFDGKTGKPRSRAEWSISNISFNNHLDDKIFEIEWPPNTPVEDRAAGKILLLGGPSLAQRKRAEELNDLVNGALTTMPAEQAKSVAIAPNINPSAAPNVIAKTPSSGITTFIIAAAGIVVSFIALGLILYARRGGKKGRGKRGQTG